MSLNVLAPEEIEIAVTDKGEPYIPNLAAIREIVREVRNRHYCFILGPHYCEKSLLLRDVKANLESSSDDLCVPLDLSEIKAVSDKAFLRGFAAMIHRRVGDKKGLSPSVHNELALQNFLLDVLKMLKRDLILLVDHLEMIRHSPLESLLRVLRAVHEYPLANDSGRLIVVAASSLSVADFSLGPVSPFNIAHRVWVRDLSAAESEKLIERMGGKDLTIAPEGRRRLIEATAGDRYLIRKLCGYCADQFAPPREVAEREIDDAINWFVERQAETCPPLRATVRAHEAKATVLMNTLMVLEKERIRRGELIEENRDDLELTGAIKIEEDAGEEFCLIRNEIYARYLRKRFRPRRVVQFLSMAGRWDEAISYLEERDALSRRRRALLLGTILDSIYAAQDKTEACSKLAQQLRQAFAIPKVSIYIVNHERSCLELVSHVGFDEQPKERYDLARREEGEIRAYLSNRNYEVVEPISGEQILYIPMKDHREPDPGSRVGLVCIHGARPDPLSDDFLEMMTFLKRVARAVRRAIEREWRVRQLAKLNELSTQVTTSLDLEQVIHKTVEAAIEAVPGAQVGTLVLWEEEEKLLRTRAQLGFRPTFADEVKMKKGDGSYVSRVFETGEVEYIANAKREDSRVLLKQDPDVGRQKSIICAPLKVWERVIGVLGVANVTQINAFQESDVRLLSTFAAQVAIAVYLARLYSELFQLGVDINRSQLEQQEMLREVARSITVVTGAKGANILLLRDTDAPHLSASQEPELSASYGLGDDYDELVRPRPDGLAFRVLRSGRPHAVGSPTAKPGLNPSAQAQGTQAYLCLPLKTREKIIGVLFVHDDKPHEYSENEINMLQLFAGHAALAIENVRQREELAMTKAVAWMGLVFSSLAHRILQKATVISRTVSGLRSLLDRKPEIEERLNLIDECAQAVQAIPGKALLPHQDRVEKVSLNAVLKSEISRWCKPTDNVNFKLAAEDVFVQADPEWLAVALELLTTNAVRAMQGSVRKRLSISSAIRGQRAVITLTNTGKEIPPEISRRLFKEPIPKSQGAEGSGVGLLIARTIMHRYHGDIEFVRSDAEGTTFSLWLPLHS